MEVHAHSHTPRNKWTHYIWEFLMLFLAVFCGFLAENEREHFIEHQREKQYIQSLARDVKTDTANITKMLTWYDDIVKNCDSLLGEYGPFTQVYTERTFRWFQATIGGFPDFIYTDRTMQQLKNAGGLRLIRKHDVTDSIIQYDAGVRDILIEEKLVERYSEKLNDFADQYFSYYRYDTKMKTKDAFELEKEKPNFWNLSGPRETEQLYNLLSNYRLIVIGYSEQLLELKNSGGRLCELLEKRY